MEREEIHVSAATGGGQTGRSARRAVRRLLGDVPIAFVRDALLLTSELTTNADTHGGGVLGVDASFDTELVQLWVCVSDGVTDVPALAPRSGAVGGLGLQLVERLADRWGWTRRDIGKSVWFELSDHARELGPSWAPSPR